MEAPLIDIAEAIDTARVAANQNEATHWQIGVYGDLAKALESTLTLIKGRADRAARIYEFILDGNSVRAAVALENAEWDARTTEIMDLLNPTWDM